MKQCMKPGTERFFTRPYRNWNTVSFFKKFKFFLEKSILVDDQALNGFPINSEIFLHLRNIQI